MGFEQGHAKAGGRRKGSQNKVTRDVQLFVDRVFARVDPLERVEALLRSESEKVQAGVLLRLLEYRYGKPKESISLSGEFSYTNELTRMRAARLAEADTTITQYFVAGSPLLKPTNAQTSGEPDKPNGHTDPRTAEVAAAMPGEESKSLHQVARELVGAEEQQSEPQAEKRIRIEL